MANAVEVQNLEFSYRRRKVLSRVTFGVQAGTVHAILGPNGAGKSTLLRLLLGLLRPGRGVLKVLGESPGRNPGWLRRVGGFIESPAVYRHLSAERQLRGVAQMCGAPNARVLELLGVVGLTQEAERSVGTYSLGMRQRLGLAQALLLRPEVLILDEPMNGLDPEGMLDLRMILVTLARREGCTVLLSTHLLGEAERVADSISILRNGSIRFTGPVEELRRRSADGTLETAYLVTGEAV